MSKNLSPVAKATTAVALAATAAGASAEAFADPLTLAIARVAHEVNKAYCEALGDPTQAVWEDAPQWQRDSAIKGVQLHLANPNLGVSASHDAWMREKLDTGWTYGPLKDPAKKEHPCIVPYADLPTEQKAKDFIFRGVVHAIAREQAR